MANDGTVECSPKDAGCRRMLYSCELEVNERTDWACLVITAKALNCTV